MKSEEYYKIKESERINKIKEDNEKSRSPELIKSFIGNEDKSLDYLLEYIIELTDVSEIKREVNSRKLFIHPMYIDLIKEYYELNEEKAKEIDEEWVSSFKSIANNILWKIRLKKNTIKSYEFHLNQAQLVGIQL